MRRADLAPARPARPPRQADEPRDPSPSTGSLRDFTAAALFYVVATLVLSYPLALHPRSLSRLDNGDARLNAWAISWVSHQLVHDPLQLFEANTFYPLPHTLAYSEHLFFEGLLALPILALTNDLVLTGNLLLLLAMFASGLGMYWLARTLTGNQLASVLAGLFFSFATFRFNRLPHIQMQFYAFLPLFLASWHRFLETRRTRDLALTSLFFVLQALAGTYLGAIAAVALAVGLVTLAPFARLTARELGRVALALVVAAGALAPFAAPYLWVNRELGIEWDLEGVHSLAATPSSYLASSAHLYRALSDYLWRDAPPTDYLFPGITLVVLGALGAVVLARKPGGRPLLLCYGVILVVGVVLSLGPRTPLYAPLYDHVVFFRGLRALTRFGLLPLLSLSVFSAFALAWLFEEGLGLGHPKHVAFGIALFFAAESTALPYELTTFEDDPPEVYSWLDEAKPGPIVELPFKVIDTQYMFWARHHDFRPMLNGDSGFVPMSHQWMKIALGRFPSEDAIALLRRLRVRYVVIHLGALREGALLRTLNGIREHRSALVPVRDFGRDLVFEVAQEPPELASEFPADPPPRLAARGNDARLFDGDTRDVVPAEAPEQVFELEIDGSALQGLRLHYGPAPRVPAARISVAVETDGGFSPRWTTPPSWPAVTELVEGLLQNPKDGTQVVTFEPLEGRRFQIRVRGLDDEPPGLTEVEALGRSGPAADPVSTEDGESKNGVETEGSI